MSGLVGQMPKTQDDLLIAKGILMLAGSQLNPDPDRPFGASASAASANEERTTSLRIGQSIAIFFVLAFTISRLCVRKFYSRSFRMDDWLIIPACFGCITYLSSGIAHGIVGCLGRHIWTCTYVEMRWFVIIAKISEPSFYFTLGFTKLSIAFGNRRITGMRTKNWEIVHWAFICTFTALLPALFFVNLIQCLPFRAGFDLIYYGSFNDPKQVKCLDRVKLAYASRVVHMVTDILLFSVPVFIILRLHMSWTKRLRLAAIFAVGGISVVASIARTVINYNDEIDITWEIYQIYPWDIVDACTAVIVASLPALNAIVDNSIKRTTTYVFGNESSFRSFFTRIKNYLSHHTQQSDAFKSLPETESTLAGSWPDQNLSKDTGHTRSFVHNFMFWKSSSKPPQITELQSYGTVLDSKIFKEHAKLADVNPKNQSVVDEHAKSAELNPNVRSAFTEHDEVTQVNAKKGPTYPYWGEHTGDMAVHVVMDRS